MIKKYFFLSQKDDEGAGLLSHGDDEENPTIARLKNIKSLADNVKQKSQAIADNLHKDTEHLKGAIDKVNFGSLRTTK